MKNISNDELKCKCCGLNTVDLSIIHRVQTVADIAEAILNRTREIDKSKIYLKIHSVTRCRHYHREIYNKINEKRRNKGLSLIEIPWQSRHLPDKDGISWAIDCSFPQLNNVEIKILNNLLEHWDGGFHYYEDEKFWHFDNDVYRRWD